MSRAIARLNDPSDHGGEIVRVNQNFVFVEEKAVACIRDLHDCPIPGHGITPIETGSQVMFINGLAVAFKGSLTGCGASIEPKQDFAVTD